MEVTLNLSDHLACITLDEENKNTITTETVETINLIENERSVDISLKVAATLAAYRTQPYARSKLAF